MTPPDRHQHTPDEERRIRDAALDETLADTFPASDPLSSNPNPDDDTVLEDTVLERPDVGDRRQGRRAVAARPDDIPLLFARSWNSRDPDALASLFDEDAEFVNVTGLWWHDRTAIRKAHAYGLERIFNASTLRVTGTRVKALGADAAVVHARMTLVGQTPIGDVRRPGTRTTIFSFVARRTGDSWSCASAQNTDVVPHMETNVVDQDGTSRTANYRDDRVVHRSH